MRPAWDPIRCCGCSGAAISTWPIPRRHCWAAGTACTHPDAVPPGFAISQTRPPATRIRRGRARCTGWSADCCHRRPGDRVPAVARSGGGRSAPNWCHCTTRSTGWQDHCARVRQGLARPPAHWTAARSSPRTRRPWQRLLFRLPTWHSHLTTRRSPWAPMKLQFGAGNSRTAPAGVATGSPP